MNKQVKFSDIGSAYSCNLYNLNEARKIFEEECKVLNSQLEDSVKSRRNAHNSDKQKFLTSIFTWGDIEPWATLKQGPWVNFVQGTQVYLNIKVPGRKVFEKNVGFLRFEMSFDDDVRRFMFKVVFQNNFARNEDLDEKVFEGTKKEIPSFPNAKHIQTSTAVLGAWELNDSLVSSLPQIIGTMFTLVEDTVANIYPEKLYSNPINQAGSGSEIRKTDEPAGTGDSSAA